MKTKTVFQYFFKAPLFLRGVGVRCILAASMLAFVACGGGGTSPAKSDATEIKIEKLLAQMTLDEKVGQMNQLSFWGMNSEVTEAIKNGKLGSMLNVIDPEQANALQKVAVEESRLGIPLIFGRDVIHGFKTMFPIPLGQAATFNPDVAREGAAVAAAESRQAGINWTFAPMLDISRDARWGRIAESLGEDPYLTEIMGEAMVRGFQGDDLASPTSIAACVKHFFGYGASEAGKDYNSTNIPPALLRNVYLRGYHAAVKAGAATVMTSFNDNDGVPATGNRRVMYDILRGEWGFDGFVVSDWGAIGEMINHGFAANPKEAALRAANAGVDMDMMSNAYPQHLSELVNEGKVSQQTIDNAVRNILRIKFRMGLFDNPYTDTTRPDVFYAENHLAAATKAAEESAVLLKNTNQTLPLTEKVKTIALIGPMADAPHDQMGTWTFDGDKNHTVTPLAALKSEYGSKVRILYEAGLAHSRDLSHGGFAKAVQTARQADVVVAVVGEEAIMSGEAHSLADISLKGAQKELIQELKKTGKPLVLIVMAGRPLTLTDELEAADALLFCFHPGTMGGPAIANLLFGKAVPSGKLPATFPKHVGQIPVYYNHNSTGRPASKGETLLYDIPLQASQTSLGNTSYHLDAGFDPLFPFGFGLSYTTFEYSNIRLSSTQLKAGDRLDVTVQLANTGSYSATEVAQLYVRDITGSIARPVRELKAFQRVHLKAGESKDVILSLTTADLEFWDIDLKRILEPGDFKVWAGGDSNATLEASFSVIK